MVGEANALDVSSASGSHLIQDARGEKLLKTRVAGRLLQKISKLRGRVHEKLMDSRRRIPQGTQFVIREIAHGDMTDSLELCVNELCLEIPGACRNRAL